MDSKKYFKVQSKLFHDNLDAFTSSMADSASEQIQSDIDNELFNEYTMIQFALNGKPKVYWILTGDAAEYIKYEKKHRYNEYILLHSYKDALYTEYENLSKMLSGCHNVLVFIEGYEKSAYWNSQAVIEKLLEQEKEE